ncbi:MAG: beta-ketoacyl-[acyl-carrier-protein] synthase family protein [Pirellulales bacterium]
MNSPPEVVITGMGVVSPIGIGRADFRDALYAGRSGVRRIESFDATALPIDFGGEVAQFDPKQYVRPRKSLKVMSREIQFGFAAADLAMVDARLASENVDSDRFGVVYGADMIYCEPEELAAAYRACVVDGRFDFDRWGGHALAEMYPLWLLKYLPNMAACHVSIALDARGPSNSITLGEVSSLVAIMEATRIIQRGAADVMLAGGASNRLHPNVMIFRNQSLMSNRRDDPAAACRPFDRDRDGMVAGEGAGAVVLESRAHADARGAKILAHVLGFGSTFAAPQRGGTSAAAARRAMETALREAGLSPADVGHVNASGLSTAEHDRAEAEAIVSLLGDVPVTAPKSLFGNLGASTAAVELAASLLALDERRVPATINYDNPDPVCAINVVRGEPAALAKTAAITLNQSPHGQSVAMVIAGAS